MNITVIGLGAMGAPMAQHLLSAGHRVTGFARNPNKFETSLSTLVQAGLLPSSDLQTSVSDADFVILNVTSTDDVLEVMSAIAPVLAPDTLVIDHSTISPDGARAAAALHAKFVDAPVSGGEVKAISGELVGMVGGADSDVESAVGIFAAYIQSHVHMGDVGTGQVAKLCNQIAQVINIQGIAEAMKFAEIQGADQHKVLQAISGGMAGSQMLNLMGPKIADREFGAGIQARLHAKDFGLAAQALGDDAGPALLATQSQLQRLMDNHWGTQDTSVLYQLLKG